MPQCQPSPDPAYRTHIHNYRVCNTNSNFSAEVINIVLQHNKRSLRLPISTVRLASAFCALKILRFAHSRFRGDDYCSIINVCFGSRFPLSDLHLHSVPQRPFAQSGTSTQDEGQPRRVACGPPGTVSWQNPIFPLPNCDTKNRSCSETRPLAPVLPAGCIRLRILPWGRARLLVTKGRPRRFRAVR